MGPNKVQLKVQLQKADLRIKCPKCNKEHFVPGYIDILSSQIKALNLQVNKNVNDNNVLVCDECGFELDLKPIKNQFEAQNRKSLNFK